MKKEEGYSASLAESSERFGKASAALAHLTGLASRMFNSKGLGLLLQTELHVRCRKNKQKARP